MTVRFEDLLRKTVDMKRKFHLTLSLVLLAIFFFGSGPDGRAETRGTGHFELGFHYGIWSVDLLRSTIETAMGDALRTELKQPLLEEIQQDYPEIVEKSYHQDIHFDSAGENFGFEMRWYPKGKNGSFSLGLSVEKTSMRVEISDIKVTIESTQGHVFQGQGSGFFDIAPLSVHLSFRWDIKPLWRINPYICFGFGLAWGNVFDTAEVGYSVSGTLVQLGQVLDTYEQSDFMTIAELKQDLEDEGEDFFLPNLFPFFQLNVGIRGEITRNIALLLEAGIWDGFILRGGLAIRF
jgi:hypothetical protein